MIVGILFWAGLLYGQDGGEALLSEIRDAYEQLDYQEAEIKARAALKNYEVYSHEHLAEIHRVLGLVYYSQNKPESAREQFHLALSLQPDLKLDPVLVSPKILEFFESVRQSRQLMPEPRSALKPEIRYIVLSDRRPAAALRSMIIPGWGQLYKKEKAKGLALGALWSAGLGGMLATHFARKGAENEYLREINAEKIEARYRTFNRYHKLRTGFALFSAAVWLVSYFDAFLTTPSKQFVPPDNLSLNTSGAAKMLTMSVVLRL